MSQTQARDSVVEGAVTRKHSYTKKDDDINRRKSQAQRLLEFEMWTNGDKTLKDLEYSQRRTEMKQRSRERRNAMQNRFWKKLYAPAVFGMVGGTFLTLCGTLQSLGGGTIFWDARPTLVVLGPALLAIGFLCLMLAAGCTFRHDQHARRLARSPSAGLILPFEESETSSQRRSILVRRSTSVDTTDMPLPEDLDPSRNGFVRPLSLGRSRRLTRARNLSIRSNESAASSAVFLMAANGNSHRQINSRSSTAYSATASWVCNVSASHSQPLAVLTRQNSDSNLRTSPGRRGCEACDLIAGCESPSPPTELREEDSQHDFCVGRTRSLTSSGYHSAGDSPTSKAENYPVCKGNAGKGSRFEGNVGADIGSSLVKKQNPDCLSASAPVQTTLFRNPRLPLRIRRGSVDSGLRQICSMGSAGPKVAACAPATLPGTLTFKHRMALSSTQSTGAASRTQPSVRKHQNHPRRVGKNHFLGWETAFLRVSHERACGFLTELSQEQAEATNVECVVQHESASDVHDVGNPPDNLGLVIVHHRSGTVKCTDV